MGALNLLPSYTWKFLPRGSSLSQTPFLSPSLHLPAFGSGHYGQGLFRSCLHHCLLVHLGALPHHSEVRDATHLSTPPGPGRGAAFRPSTSAQEDLLLTTLQHWPLASELAGSRDFIYSQERGKKPPFFFHLGCGWLGCADGKMNGKVRSILCGKIFAFHKAPVFNKVFILCHLPGAVKRT